jgi:dihydrofolate reductase
MRKVVLKVSDYSLDGIIGEENTEFFDFCRDLPDDPAQEAWVRSFLEGAAVHIMGRVTFQGMAQYFPTADGHPYAKVMNAADKVVFSSTLTATDWANATIFSGGLTEGIDRLRTEGTGEIVAHGGISFAQSLVRLDLVDEYRLSVFPYLVGRGRSLFTDGAKPRDLEHVSSAAFDNGIVGHVYRRRR